MAGIKLAYIGGGSSRAPGTMASLIAQGENFQGSHIVLIDLDHDRLELVKTLAEKMARQMGIDLIISITTNRREGLSDCDTVLTSYRPGGFEARYIDESIPLKHGIIGQETQGPGGFFMALRSIYIMKSIIEDMEAVCPRAWLFNYTNPINIVSQAVTRHSAVPTVSLCEGPIIFPQMIARAADLDPNKVEAVMIGLNHGSWSVRHLYDGQDMMPFLEQAYERKKHTVDPNTKPMRMLKLAVMMQSIPADYFQYYYYFDEVLAESKAKPTTRAQDIMAKVPDYWKHYREQAESSAPRLDPTRSRGGIHELELAIDAIDAVFNNRGEILPVNVPNQGAIPEFADDLVVEVPGYIDHNGVTPLVQPPLPRHVAGLVKMLAEYQVLAAEAAWNGRRRDAIRALSSHPFMSSLDQTEVIYDEMASALKAYLPERLLS